MQLTTALNGYVNSFDFFNRYKHSGGLVKIEQTITQRNTDLTNSGNTLSSGAGVNLSSGGNMALVGAQICGQGGVNISAGGNYSEQAAYDLHEQVNIQSSRTSGVGTYLADALNNTAWLATAGAAGGRTETAPERLCSPRSTVAQARSTARWAATR